VVFGLCPLSGILENTRFQQFDLFAYSNEGVGGTCGQVMLSGVMLDALVMVRLC
jgi:hypothetical protein